MLRVSILVALASACTSCAVSSRPAVPIRVVSYNVKHGIGYGVKPLGENLRSQAQRITEQQPDLVALQEIDEGCGRSQFLQETELFARLTKMHGAFAKFMDLDGGRYGLAILSRRPIEASSVVRLKLPPGKLEPRTALLTHYTPRPGVTVVFVCVHFDWLKRSAARYAQAQKLLEYLGGVDWPVIVVGDFNDEPGSPTLRAFEAAGFEYVPKAEAGARFTFDAKQPSVEIDHVFLRSSRAIELRADPIVVVPEKLASDHRPIVTTVYAVQRERRE